MKETVVLAFSGGLDTTYCVKYLSQEKNLSVHAVLVNTGGFSEAEIQQIQAHAESLGVSSFVVLNEVPHYYEKCIRYLVFGNVLKNHTYPLSVSAERVFQAMAVANYAKHLKANYVAHGSTGAGNDQVRFDLVFQILIPNIGIITPIRDQQLSREAEIAYLKAEGVNMNWEKAAYSINKGLWGTSVGGKETLNAKDYLPDEAFPSPKEKEEEEIVTLHFSSGELSGINEKKLSPIKAIAQLTQLASPFAIGRDTHVGDTIIGIKGRVGFEAPASLITIEAHRLLEKHVLTKWQMYWKDQLAEWYGMLLHEGQFLDPVMRNIEAFLISTQTYVTGKVQVRLAPYRFELLGTESDYDLMSAKFGTYGEMNRAWSGEDVKGFTTILANSTKIYHQIHSDQPTKHMSS